MMRGCQTMRVIVQQPPPLSPSVCVCVSVNWLNAKLEYANSNAALTYTSPDTNIYVSGGYKKPGLEVGVVERRRACARMWFMLGAKFSTTFSSTSSPALLFFAHFFPFLGAMNGSAKDDDDNERRERWMHSSRKRQKKGETRGKAGGGGEGAKNSLNLSQEKPSAWKFPLRKMVASVASDSESSTKASQKKNLSQFRGGIMRAINRKLRQRDQIKSGASAKGDCSNECSAKKVPNLQKLS